jgi:hypothetical protein
MTEPLPEPVVLYPFRFVDPLTGKWVRARYRASREELELRYRHTRWEITGEPMVITDRSGSFNPHRGRRSGRPALPFRFLSECAGSLAISPNLWSRSPC